MRLACTPQHNASYYPQGLTNGELYPWSCLTLDVPVPETRLHCSLHMLEKLAILEGMANYFFLPDRGQPLTCNQGKILTLTNSLHHILW